jgi:hypothetical protein
MFVKKNLYVYVIMSGVIKFIPYTVGGAIGGLVGGLGLSMVITTAKGENPWDESQPLQPHTKVIVPFSCVVGALLGASKAFA